MRRKLVTDERGVTLVLTLFAMTVLSLTTAAVLTATAVNHRSAYRSDEAAQAFALAQQGLAYAEGRLYSSPTTAEAVLVPGTTITPTDNTGTITYHGSLCDGNSTPPCSPKVWTLYGTGTVDNISRTISAQVTIPLVTSTVTSSTPVTTTDTTIWNYIYIDNPAGCTTLSGNVSINVPLYTRGGLCLSGNATYTGSDLEVGGQLSLTGNAKIGSSSQPISKLNVVGACSPSPCDGFHSPIYVNVPGVGHTLTPTETKPTVDLQGTYNAEMGQTQSGCPSNFFDNQNANHTYTLNDSNGTINLFPSGVPYDCKVGSNELKWDGASHLTANGTFYFDGNLSMSGNTQILYSGKATLYFTGTANLSGNGQICGIASCAGTWDPSTNAIVVVAGCQNSSGGSITSGCTSVSGNFKLQAGIYSNTDFTISGNGVDYGPVITTTASFSGNDNQMLPFHSLPPGAPANTTTTYVTTETTTTSDGAPSAPSNWNG